MYLGRVSTTDRFPGDPAVIFRGAKKYLKNTEKYRENTGKFRESSVFFSRGVLTLLENAETEWATPRWFANRKLIYANYVDRTNCWWDGLVESWTGFCVVYFFLIFPYFS